MPSPVTSSSGPRTGSTALPSAPRENKNKKKGVIEPLLLDAGLSSDPEDFRAEVKRYFKALFEDPSNDAALQRDRLDRLRESAAGEHRIHFPRFLLEEGLARGRRKSTTSPGHDQLSWSALCNMSTSLRLHLVSLFEKRLNIVDGHDQVVASWTNIVACLLPKKKNREPSPSTAPSLLPHACRSCIYIVLVDWWSCSAIQYVTVISVLLQAAR